MLIYSTWALKELYTTSLIHTSTHNCFLFNIHHTHSRSDGCAGEQLGVTDMWHADWEQPWSNSWPALPSELQPPPIVWSKHTFLFDCFMKKSNILMFQKGCEFIIRNNPKQVSWSHDARSYNLKCFHACCQMWYRAQYFSCCRLATGTVLYLRSLMSAVQYGGLTAA